MSEPNKASDEQIALLRRLLNTIRLNDGRTHEEQALTAVLDELERSRKELLSFRRSLIGWRTRAFPFTNNQEQVVDRDFPVAAALAAPQTEEKE